MSKENSKIIALTPRAETALIKNQGQGNILQRMALELLTQNQALISQKRYRIGEYEFSEADQGQLEYWAKRLGINREDLVERLALSVYEDHKNFEKKIKFEVRDGSIKSLVWSFPLLDDWGWADDLSLNTLVIECWSPNNHLNLESLKFIYSERSEEKLLKLPTSLRALHCRDNYFIDLNLANAINLEILDCSATAKEDLYEHHDDIFCKKTILMI